MHAITALYGAILFVLLTPGLVLRIPSKGTLLIASIVHAVVFGIIFYFISKIVHQNSRKVESFITGLRRYQIYNDNSDGCNATKCQSATDGNKLGARKDVIEECKGCNLVANEDDEICKNLSHCNTSIIGHLNELKPIPDEWWDSNQACNGCTRLRTI